MLQKNWKFSGTGCRLYGPLNWVCIVIMSMGKISAASLNISSSVYIEPFSKNKMHSLKRYILMLIFFQINDKIFIYLLINLFIVLLFIHFKLI